MTFRRREIFSCCFSALVLFNIAVPLSSTGAPATRKPPTDEPATLLYDEVLDPEQKNPMAARMSAEAAIRANRADRAIFLSRKALARRPDDLEFHKTLAEALDLKLETQKEKDPKVVAECVREWLIVMRNGVGMEKGTNFRGAGGILDAFYSDEEYYILAKERIKELTGKLPRAWETNDRFLKRALPAAATVSGKILHRERK